MWFGGQHLKMSCKLVDSFSGLSLLIANLSKLLLSLRVEVKCGQL